MPITMKLNELTIDVLKVLALPNSEKINYFGKWEEGRVYVFPDTGIADGFSQPAECFALLARRVFHEYRQEFYEEPGSESIRNVFCAVEMAITCGYTVGYFWNIGPEKNITGPLDDIWQVLTALSTVALAQRSIPVETPKTTFAEMLAYWHVKQVQVQLVGF